MCFVDLNLVIAPASGWPRVIHFTLVGCIAWLDQGGAQAAVRCIAWLGLGADIVAANK